MTPDATMLQAVVVVGRSAVGALGTHAALSEVARKITPAEDAQQAIQAVRLVAPNLVIICETVAPTQAILLLTQLKQLAPQTPVVVLAENPSVDMAVRLTRAGAYDYLRSPLDRQSLRRLLQGMEMEQSLAQRNHGRFFHGQCPSGVLIAGQSAAMQRCLEMIRLVAESRCNPVLILGETGTGKELAAKAIHAWRCGDPDSFVAVNCAALTANLLESELFGHVRGAFTGADREKTGLFELAGAGSIFLDEISEMAPELQAKLLRVLQEKTFRKVGGTKDLQCNATIIASSNRNLLDEVAKGKFRQDLYYRLAVFPITIAPLRDIQRREDIPLLAQYFIETTSIPNRNKIQTLSKAAQDMLMTHNWPGNVRELRNVIDRAMILERGGEIGASSLVLDGHEHQPAPVRELPQAAKPVDFSLETAEREFIVRALKETGWQRTRAAALLGITRATLHAKLKRYDIRVPAGSPASADSLPQDPNPENLEETLA